MDELELELDFELDLEPDGVLDFELELLLEDERERVADGCEPDFRVTAEPVFERERDSLCPEGKALKSRLPLRSAPARLSRLRTLAGALTVLTCPDLLSLRSLWRGRPPPLS